MSRRFVLLLGLGLAALALTAAPALGGIIDIRITNGGDDVEEHINDGSMDITSSDLEFPYEDDGTPSATDPQLVGLRFNPIPLPKGTTVTKSYLEFEMDETKGNSRPVNVIIEGQLIANAPAFTSTARDLTNRTPRTTAQVKWTVPLGLAVDAKFQSPDISSIINEILRLDGWAAGNALVLIIRDDPANPSTGLRCVEAYEGESANAPLLRLEFFSPYASAPSPKDGAAGVAMPLLSWTKGDGAIFHNVYFGTSPNLTDADRVAQNQPFAMYYHVPGVEPGLTYYWRVDEVDMTGKIVAGPVWSFSTPSQKAYDPSPRDRARNVATDVKLTWTAGHGAVSHTVYFGTSLEQVSNATGGTPQAVPIYTPASPLAKDTTYYWRVDETDGKTTHKGNVWSFTTMPDIKITDPDLVGWWPLDDGAGTVALDFSGHGNNGRVVGGTQWIEGVVGGALELTGNGYVVIDGIAPRLKANVLTFSAWIKSTRVSSAHGVIFCPNGSDSDYSLQVTLRNGSISIYDGSRTDYPPIVADGEWHHVAFVLNGPNASVYVDGAQRGSWASSMNFGTMTRWSIGQEWDGSTASDFYTGAVDEARAYSRALTADQIQELLRGDPTQAWKPSPANGATVDVIAAEKGLTWAAGDKAKQHDVYFGKDQAAVTSANPADTTGVYRGRRTQTSYIPTEELAWGSGPYYWRIDEVLDSGAITTGNVWSFSVADFLVVDNMESYTDAEGNRIYESWIDGWTNNTGAVVGNLTAPFAERTIVRPPGRQSLPMDYDNTKSPFYSEASLTFAPQQNWTTHGVTDLSVWFRGRPVAYVDKGNGAFTVSASGHDIWDNADDFRFVYKRLNGNGSITVRVDSLVNTNAWAKAGVMIRDSLEDGSVMAYMIQSATSGVSFGWRPTFGLACDSRTQAGIVAPQWVKLTRTGNAFTAQYSANGTTWTDVRNTDGTVASINLGMGASVYIGLCVTSHDTALTTTAEFSGAATTGGVTGAWQQAWIGDDPDRTNSGAEAVYVAVTDSTNRIVAVTHPNPAASTLGAWTEWRIPLSSFTGVNMARVKSLHLGVGSRTAPVKGGAGRIYIDDIRLTKP
ncbi:MAG: hypothetical protein FJ280_17155 [Planctomycetes bacterium]|nr:hypothetical protein [Planctomycetota bacterium]